MAKNLKDILKGVKSSSKKTLKTGDEPGVDYLPKAGAERDFEGAHEVEVHADRVGNGDDVYKGKTKYSLDNPKNKLLGHKKGADKNAYDKDNGDSK